MQYVIFSSTRTSCRMRTYSTYSCLTYMRSTLSLNDIVAFSFFFSLMRVKQGFIVVDTYSYGTLDMTKTVNDQRKTERII